MIETGDEIIGDECPIEGCGLPYTDIVKERSGAFNKNNATKVCFDAKKGWVYVHREPYG